MVSSKIFPIYMIFLISLTVSTTFYASTSVSYSLRGSFEAYYRVSTSLIYVLVTPDSSWGRGSGNATDPVESLRKYNEDVKRMEEVLASAGIEVIEYRHVASNVFPRPVDELLSLLSNESSPYLYDGFNFDKLPPQLRPRLLTGRMPSAPGECAVGAPLYEALKKVGRGDVLNVEVPVFLSEPPYVGTANFSCRIVGVFRVDTLQQDVLGMTPTSIIVASGSLPESFKNTIQIDFVALGDPDRIKEQIERVNSDPLFRKWGATTFTLKLLSENELASMKEDVSRMTGTFDLLGAILVTTILPVSMYLSLSSRRAYLAIPTQLGRSWRSVTRKMILSTLISSGAGILAGFIMSQPLSLWMTGQILDRLHLPMAGTGQPTLIVVLSASLLISVCMAVAYFTAKFYGNREIQRLLKR